MLASSSLASALAPSLLRAGVDADSTLRQLGVGDKNLIRRTHSQCKMALLVTMERPARSAYDVGCPQ
jgi:hypothetical protein